jgi:pimeloyl-ACP methyl ester carboxylesterase
MEGFTRAAFWVAARAPFLLYLYLGLLHSCLRRWPEVELRGLSRVFPQPDVQLLERPDVRAALLSDVQQPAWPQAQDMVLDTCDWGFRLQDISIPVHVWHGDADKNVPFVHGKGMAERIPGAQFHACPGEGHLLVVTHLEQILRTLSAAS